MPENLISIQEVRWYEKNDPRWLTFYTTSVYDKDGNVTYIRAYKLDEMLGRGFLASPPGEDPIDDTPVAPAVIPEPMTGLVSSRTVHGKRS